MTSSELKSIKESIEKIERFPIGYPKLITDVDEKWLAFFQWEYMECFRRRNALSTDKGEEQMKLVV